MAAAAKLQVVEPGFKIETNVPMPTTSRVGAPEGPLRRAMRELAAAEVGASVFVPAKLHPKTLYVAAYRVGGRGWFATRTVDGGQRIWKLSEPKRA